MKKFLKSLSVFLLYMIYPAFMIIPFELANVDINVINLNIKILYLLLFDLMFLCFLIYMYKDTLIRDLKDYKKNYRVYIDEGIKYWIIGLLIMVISNSIIGFVNNTDMANNESVVRDMIDRIPIYMIFATIIFAPLVEELIFRKSFKDMFNTKWIFIIMSGLVFGGLHVVSDFKNFNELLYIIPYGSLGAAFAYLYYKTNNIYNSIIMHAVHNGTLVVLFLLTK